MGLALPGAWSVSASLEQFGTLAAQIWKLSISDRRGQMRTILSS